MGRDNYKITFDRIISTRDSGNKQNPTGQHRVYRAELIETNRYNSGKWRTKTPKIRNMKIAAQLQAMHDKWLAAKQERAA